MGVPEFSSSLTDFNQAQLDAIEQATRDVLTAVNAIKNTDISLLNNKIGTNADESGTSTVFARLVQLVGYVDTIETLIGLNSNAAGTTTLFARLAQIANASTFKVKLPQKAAIGINNVVKNDWYLMMSVNGKGAVFNVTCGSAANEIKIINDGVETIFITKIIDSNFYFETSLSVYIRYAGENINQSISGSVDYGLV